MQTNTENEPTPREIADDLITAFSNPSKEKIQAKMDAMLCTEKIIGALYDYGIRRPEFWYDVQKEIDI